jgi:lipid-A-disaccharide synthase
MNIIDFEPDALILVDYAGFNLKIARFAKKKGVKVYFYISPKVWAWKKGRIKKLKADIDRLFVIFPFEKEFFLKNNLEVDYVGNPLVERISAFHKDEDFLKKNKLSDSFIALMPGSRKQEINKILPTMISLASEMTARHFVIAASQNSKAIYEKFQLPSNVSIVYQATYDLLSYAKAAIVTSGTATLETALFNVPQVVVYNTSTISYWIASKVVDRSYLKHISLVNIIAQQEVVKELIQKDYTVEGLKKELVLLLDNKYYIKEIIQQYQILSDLLSNRKSSEEVVRIIVEDLSNYKI